MTLLVRNCPPGLVGTAGFCGFWLDWGVFLSGEGGMVGNGWSGWGFGGWNCVGKVVLFGEGGVGVCFCWLCLSA